MEMSKKLTADFGVAMHIAWTRHLLDNREFIVGGGTQPNTEPSRGEGLDGAATAEERDNYHRDAYENARNHASGPRAAPPHPLLSPDACLPVRDRAPYPFTDRTRPPGGRSKNLS